MFCRQTFGRIYCVGLQHVVMVLELSNSARCFEHHCVELEVNIRKDAEAEKISSELLNSSNYVWN